VEKVLHSRQITALETAIPALFVERSLWNRKCEIHMSKTTPEGSVSNVQFASRDWVRRMHLKVTVKFTVKQGPISVKYVANSLRHTVCLKNMRDYMLEVRTTAVSFVTKHSGLQQL